MRLSWSFAILACLLALTVPCQSATTSVIPDGSTEATSDASTLQTSSLTETQPPTTGPSEASTSGTAGTADTTITDGLTTSSTDTAPDTTVTEGATESSTRASDTTVTEGATATRAPDTTVTEGATESSTRARDTTVTEGATESSTRAPDTTVTEGATASPSSTRAPDTTVTATEASTERSTESPPTTIDRSSGTSAGESTVDSTRAPITPNPSTAFTQTTLPPTVQPDASYEVQTPYGKIGGITYTVVKFPSGHPFASTKRISKFLGMPYAEPPTGNRRFKSPVKVQAGSNSTLNATVLKPNCPQQGQASPTEDCLHYNIWTVQTAENANASVAYPVLLWIHGGRFETGGSANHLRQGEELATHENTVVVTFNYRLGALGFLTLNRTSYTGNYGIQDQQVAIQVIYDVLPFFGGNQSQIALMGLDAGAASIGFHLMNSQTSALFSRVIMMGGSPMMPWSLTNDIEYVQLLNLLFTVGGLNCTTLTNEAVLSQCLQNVPISKLVSLQNNFTRFFQGLEFSPVIDGNTITEDPWHAFSTGNFSGKDLLIGATNDEGANIAEDSLEVIGIPIHGVNDSMLLSLIERSIMFYPRASRVLSATGRQFLRLHFTRYTGVNDGKANFDTLGKAIGDWYLTCPVIQMAQFAEKKNPNVYLYYFTEMEISQNKWNGASHGEDANYAFGAPTLSGGIIYPADKKRLSERMMQHVVQFAKDGRPAITELWKPLNYTVGNEMNYINYNADARILGNYQRGYRLAECHFWNKTLAYVNDLERPVTTTVAPGTTTTTTTAPTTVTATRPPIGPCDAWQVNSATATTMGVLLSTQLVTAGALAFVIFKWKALSKVGAEAMPMN